MAGGARFRRLRHVLVAAGRRTGRTGKLQRFGFITTNSITQTFNRRIIQHQLTATPPLALAFAVPDHPWVDSVDGAAVRIAMTVGKPAADGTDGVLSTVGAKRDGSGEGFEVELTSQRGLLHAELTIGANVAGAGPLVANSGLSCPGTPRSRLYRHSRRSRGIRAWQSTEFGAAYPPLPQRA